MARFRIVKITNQYGPLPPDFTYEFRDGYTALVGPNNSGKSALLQLLFSDLTADSGIGRGRVALILPDREYVEPTTETAGRTLEAWSNDLRNQLQGVPLTYGSSYIGPSRSELVRVLMHGDLVAQFNAMNELLVRMGLEPFRLRARQQIEFRDFVVAVQGSGLRGALPILAALTNPDVDVVLIDEPELSLEPRLQKVLRDVLIDASEQKVIIVATHSHLFVRRDQIDANQRMTRDVETNEVTIKTLTEQRELYDEHRRQVDARLHEPTRTRVQSNSWPNRDDPHIHATSGATRSRSSSAVHRLSRLCKPEVTGSIPVRSIRNRLLDERFRLQ